MAESIGETAAGSSIAIPTRFVPVESPYEVAVVRNGHTIYMQNAGQINRDSVRSVIDRSLDERLVPHYFDNKQHARFYLTEGHLGVGVLQDAYIDILGVEPSRWGNGIARALMDTMTEDAQGKFVLRSQPISKRQRANEWYSKLAKLIGEVVNVDGITYNVYAKGISEAEEQHWLGVTREKPSNFELKRLL